LTALRVWSNSLKEFGLKPTNADPCIYTSDDDDLLVALYVDNGLVFGKCKMKIDKLLKAMQQQFEIISSDATCYLGIEIIRNREEKTIFLTQTAYATAYETAYAAYTREVWNDQLQSSCYSMDTGATLTTNMDEDLKNIPFRQLIGSLIYLAVATQPDLVYLVGILSKFLDSPTEEHWNAGKRVD